MNPAPSVCDDLVVVNRPLRIPGCSQLERPHQGGNCFDALWFYPFPRERGLAASAVVMIELYDQSTSAEHSANWDTSL